MRTLVIVYCLTISSAVFSQINEDLSLHFQFENDLLDIAETMIRGTEMGGAVTYDEGVDGKAIYFSDEGEYVYINTSFQLELPFSISTWVKPQDLSRAWQTTISKYQEAFFGSFWFGLHFDKVNMWLPIGNGQEIFYDSETSISIDEWSHIVWVCDQNNQGRMYINGEPDAVMGFIPDVFQNSDSLMLGRQALFLDITNDYANFFGGMDDLRVYSKALDALEVEQLFSMTSSTIDTEPELIVFPNPCSGRLYIQGMQEPTILEIVDNIGNVILQRELNDTDHMLDLSTWINGIYYCSFRNKKATWTTKLQVLR